MAFDLYAFGVTEADQVSAGAVANFYTSGVVLDNPQYGAAGFQLEMDAGMVVNCDAVVQTQSSQGTVATATDWHSTNSRINGIVAAGVYALQITDPVLDRLRLHLINVGNLTGTLRTRWYADRSLTLL